MGATKIADEAIARAYHHRFDLDSVSMRYMNVYGPPQKADEPNSGVVTNILRVIKDGRNPRGTGDGQQKRDLVHVNDCARTNVCALKADVTHKFLNVGTGVDTTISDLAMMLLARHSCGSTLGIEHVPATTVSILNWVVGTREASRSIGFSSRVTPAEGLDQLVNL